MQTKSKERSERAQKFCASGTQTYSKHPKRYVEGIYPEFIESGKGAFVHDGLGNTYIDYVAGLGANLLGYAHPYINDVVKRRMDEGVIFSLPSSLEGELAEELNALFPYMEKMRFLKSGSEACSAAVKIARAYTNREMVISIGYHGWHDWAAASSLKSAGSPARLAPLCLNAAYNDIETLRDYFKEDGKYIAAVIMEPYIFEEPRNNYLLEVAKLCKKNGSLLIFDEVVTGMRFQNYSVANHYEINPDIFILGKPLANGFPMAVVGCRKKIMDVLDADCFVSSTFGGDLVGISAALATLEVCKSENVWQKIQESGEMLKEVYNQVADNLGLDTECFGNPCRLSFKFPSEVHRAVFWQECLKQGVFFGYATHTTLAHTSTIIDSTIDAVKHSLSKLKGSWETPYRLLEGKVPDPVKTVSAKR